jgi:hypothetical protein
MSARPHSYKTNTAGPLLPARTPVHLQRAKLTKAVPIAAPALSVSISVQHTLAGVRPAAATFKDTRAASKVYGVAVASTEEAVPITVSPDAARRKWALCGVWGSLGRVQEIKDFRSSWDGKLLRFFVFPLKSALLSSAQASLLSTLSTLTCNSSLFLPQTGAHTQASTMLSVRFSRL